MNKLTSILFGGSDGLDDGWEREHFGNLITPALTCSPTRHYRINSSPDLTTWTASISGWFSGFESSTTASEPLAEPQTRYFFKITAKRPLAP